MGLPDRGPGLGELQPMPLPRPNPRREVKQSRTRIVVLIFALAYVTITARLVQYGIGEPAASGAPVGLVAAHRPAIVDRHGRKLAIDLKTYSLFAEPRRIVDVDDAIERLRTVFPDLDVRDLHARLSGDRGFIWLKRHLSPQMHNRIMTLGIPGIGFRSEIRRFYPAGRTTAHVVGLTNVDNLGTSGLERWIDTQGYLELRDFGLGGRGRFSPVETSIDLRIQHAVHDELARAMVQYEPAGAGGLVLNIKTGEILALVSLPDFDPNSPVEAHLEDRLNRMSGSAAEMGSIIKTFTTAMAIEKGRATLSTVYDASSPLAVGRQRVRDYYGKNRPLTLEEVFLYSSNIGSALEARAVGIEEHRNFLRSAGLLTKLQLELPEVATPREPARWSSATSITASFGHGFATTPLQTAAGIGGILNNGILVSPTLIRRGEEDAKAVSKRIVSDHTSEMMRYLYRLSGMKGSGRHAAVAGLNVGGKTGTAEKVIAGRYARNRNYNVFAAAMPMHDPVYLYLVVIDDPKPKSSTRGLTAGVTAAPVTGNIIRRTFGFLDVTPSFGTSFQPHEENVG
ncbi:cell division protein FtsI (penicillin-binding protein 3) [Aminobacter sp. J44]|nr:cell division protein FtsI (penicillin-binding protein 3) [Aminobacter sp. J44]